MKLKKMSLVIGCILLLLGFISYTVWDNNRVVVDKVSLSSQKLPENLDGYTILQITDLHGKSFGKDQKTLVNLIKKQKYDLVLFTGDYVSDDNQSLNPLEDLLKALPTEKEMFYILGSTDEDNSVATLVSGNRFYDLFIKYGVKPLYPGQKIINNGDSIWLKTNPYASVFYEISRDIPQELINAKNEFDAQYKSASNPFTIEVSHRPTEIDYENELIHDYRTNILNETDKEWIDWDFSINGHTHGGQMVLPFIGPLYAPSHGLLPGKINVKGVHSKNGHTQYVCPGLGVSGPSFAKFRLFNTPSIGLITLKKI